jgi:putative RecB family exonuclease
MPNFSNSKLSTFEQCPLRYKYQYIDKVEIEEWDIVEAFMGSRVHDALEKLYKDLKLQRLNSLENILAYFNDHWEKNWTDDIKIAKKEFTADNYRRTGEKCIVDYYKKICPF